MVKEVWSFYEKTSRPGTERDMFDKKFNANYRQALEWKQRLFSGKLILNGIRSAAPAAIGGADEELPKFHEHYWKHGISEESVCETNEAKFPNPMLTTMNGDPSLVHYGTDPLFGFHLATAYTPLSLSSPLRPNFDKSSTRCKAVQAARAQFQAWAAAFRKKARQNIAIRFLVGDALAFCHTLQHKAVGEEQERASWYSGQYTWEPLTLYEKDYNRNGKAPLTFNVIDTSNLSDHVGIINILIATTPLLERSSWSNIYTELLVKQEDDPQALTESLLCGHFTTMSTLLGLYPAEFFSNATAISNSDQKLMDFRMEKDSKFVGQQLHRLAWKLSCSSTVQEAENELDQPLHFHEEDLAHLLHQTYAMMFRRENIATIFTMDPRKIMSQMFYYHRGSFASLLRYVKNVSKVQWDKMMCLLFDLIDRDGRSPMRGHHYQEFYTYLHLLGLHTPNNFHMSSHRFSSNVIPNSVLKGLPAWKEIPPVVCITLKVPRANLRTITNMPTHELGTPHVQCIIQGPRTGGNHQWHNIFCAVQLSFGKIATLGDRNSDDFQLQIKNDSLNWEGASPLLVSFYVPSHVILEEPTAALISFGFQINPRNVGLFMKKLGIELSLFETNLGDQEHVFVTKYLPNQQGHPSICCHLPRGVESKDANSSFRTRTTAHVSHSTGRITEFTGRIDFLSEVLKSALVAKAVIQADQLSPRTVQITVGENGSKHLLHFPTPVLNSRAKTRIARKSAYIEMTVSIADHSEGTRYPNSLYPIFAARAEPVLWNMPFLNLDSLPIISTTTPQDLIWLNLNISLQMSAREWKSREYSMAHPEHIQKGVRINFKDNIFSMFTSFAGIQSPDKTRIMCLSSTERDIQIIICISELRLDVGNQTAILDAAILPPLPPEDVPCIRKFLQSLPKAHGIYLTASDEEIKLWKEVLPAYVERCRTWKHLPSCEYNVKSKIPLTTDSAQPFLCSCGNGTVPSDFIKDIPQFGTASKYMVRAAISPSYAMPFVEKMVSLEDLEAEKKDRVSVDNIKGKKLETVADDDAKVEKSEEKSLDAEKCGNCGRTKHVRGCELSVCGKCHRVKYCSAECQKMHWKDHKKACAKSDGEVKNGGKAGGGEKDEKDLNDLVEAMKAEGLD